jgi:translation initiation factor 2B subunit (eIF-2B alpha/beta/delta family)
MRLNEIKEVLLLWGFPSGKAIEEIKESIRANRDLSVLVPEMRPSLLGLAVAKRLTEENIKNVYATDNMLGFLFFKQKVNEVLFFYKDLAEQNFSGICGSLYVCLLARLHGVPIKAMQGEKMKHCAQGTSLLDGYMSLSYNDALPAEDEAVPEQIIR